jgi:anti-sigma regulatory factor (Ser/Thr protein kinase)
VVGTARPTTTPLVERSDQTSPTVGDIETEPLISEVFDQSRVTALRHTVASRAAAAGLAGERLDDFVVAVNELLTNAVRHGGGAGRVVLWRHDDAVICEVVDQGAGMGEPWVPHDTRPAPDVPGGWGLWLAGRLTDTFEVSSDAAGTAVRISSRIT